VNKYKQTFLNLSTNFLAFLIQFVISFFVTRTVVTVAGQEANGFLGMANDFIVYLSVISAVLNSVVSRFITIALNNNDIERANRYYNSTLLANLVLAAFFVIVGVLFIPNMDKVLDINPSLVNSVKITFMLTLITYIITVITSIFTVGTYVKNRLDINAVRNTIQYLIRLILIIIFFVTIDVQIYFVSVASMVATFCIAISNIKLNKRLLPELKFDTNYFSIVAVKEIVASGCWIGLSNLSTIFIRYLDLVVSNLFLGATVMGLLSTARTMPNYITSLVTTMGALFSPEFVIAFAKNDIDELVVKVKRAMKLMALMLYVPICGFIMLSDTYYRLWLHSVSQEDLRIIITLSTITIIQAFLNSVTLPVAQLSVVTNKVKLPVIVSFLCGIGNLVVVAVLLKFTSLGVYAIVLSSTGILLLRYIVFNCWYGEYMLGIKRGTFFKQLFSIIPLIPLLLVTFWGIKKVMSPYSWITFIVCCSVCGIIGYGEAILFLKVKKNMR